MITTDIGQYHTICAYFVSPQFLPWLGAGEVGFETTTTPFLLQSMPPSLGTGYKGPNNLHILGR